MLQDAAGFTKKKAVEDNRSQESLARISGFIESSDDLEAHSAMAAPGSCCPDAPPAR